MLIIMIMFLIDVSPIAAGIYLSVASENPLWALICVASIPLMENREGKAAFVEGRS